MNPINVIKTMNIRKMLGIWTVTAISSILILAAAGVFTNMQLDSYQGDLIRTFSIEESVRSINIIVADLIVRQSNIQKADSISELESFPSIRDLESVFKKERDKLASFQTSVIDAGLKTHEKEVLNQLYTTFSNLLRTNDLLFDEKMGLLKLQEQLGEHDKMINQTARDVRNMAESIAGKVNYLSRRTERKIRRAMEDPEKEPLFRKLVAELLVGKQANIQSKSADICTGVAELSGLNRQMMLETSSDVLTSIKVNQILQTVKMINEALAILIENLKSSPELLSITQQLNDGLSKMTSLLTEGGQSTFSLRAESIYREQTLGVLLSASQNSINVMMEELGNLSRLAGDIRGSVVKESKKISVASMLTVMLVGLITLGIISALTMVIYRIITRPLLYAVKVSNMLADGDLTADIQTGRQDETGQLLLAMKNMIGKFGGILKMVSDTTTKNNVLVLDISSAAQQQSVTASEQSSAVTEISATIEELSASSAQIADNAESVAGIAARTLDKTENGVVAVQTLLDQMGEINEGNQNSINGVVDLGKKSKEITKVMAIINQIADQTKLLAFNAALEASSAGEAGKRFGVVASEIRRLADSVMESTEEIEGKINEIQNAVNHLVIASEKGTKKIQEGMVSSSQTSKSLQEILEDAQSTTDAVKEISLSTQQQSTASEQVLTALREIVEGARQNSDSIDQISDISKDLADLSGNLKALVEKFKLSEDQQPENDLNESSVP